VTDRGPVRCENVVNAGGSGRTTSAAWWADGAAIDGAQYLVTKPIAGVTREIPTMRDPDRLV